MPRLPRYTKTQPTSWFTVGQVQDLTARAKAKAERIVVTPAGERIAQSSLGEGNEGLLELNEQGVYEVRSTGATNGRPEAIASIARQLKRGADPKKLKLIPNGINVQQLAHLRQQKNHTSNRFMVGFVGRIVPIKDVKTFIRALKIASETIPNLEVYLVGPTEEDTEYFQECQRLVEVLDLESVAHFTGSADVRIYYSQLDVLVLTSLSEGQPLVVLEGNCAGIPVIATDVGACRELLMGISIEDRALGDSGIITPVASPNETARAIIRLWHDEGLRLRMGRAGQKRTERFYRQEQLYSTYNNLYQHYIAQNYQPSMVQKER